MAAFKFTDVLKITALVHWKKIAAAGVLGLVGMGYYLGSANNEPQIVTPTPEAAEQAAFNVRAREAFADLGLKPTQTTLVFAKNKACAADQPYGADFEAVNTAGKTASGTICMTKERQGRIILGR